MNYEKIYAKLIESRKYRILDSNEYYERHHIWPKCLSGPDEDWNIVYLTAREHFIAHWLLYKMTSGDDRRRMGNALWCMCQVNKHQKRKFTSRQYEEARKVFNELNKGKTLSKETKIKISKSLSGENHPMYGRTHSIEAKIKIGESKTGENHPNFGKSLSNETKNKISKSNSNPSDETRIKKSMSKRGKNNPNFGKSPSEETKKKNSESNIGKKHSEETKEKLRRKRSNQKILKCPHCGKEGGKSNMKRYHFDNCKMKK